LLISDSKHLSRLIMARSIANHVNSLPVDVMEEEPKQQVVPQADALGEDLVSSFKELVDSLRAWWEEHRDSISTFMEWAAVNYPRARLLEATGWLPHYTTPELDPDMDVEAADQAISQHYKDAWPALEAAFQERLASWRIDDEAKACFEEALAAHRYGLYRVAPRLLFPEIERLARAELGGVLEINASQRELRHAASELGSANFVRTGVLTLRLFGAFADRIYAKAETDAELETVRADPVPNRHAALHGLAVYNTQKSSLNALIIAEFVLLTIDAVKAEERLHVGTVSVETDQDGGAVTDAGYPFPPIAGGRTWDVRAKRSDNATGQS
jgi:hypothetical protein